MGLFNTILEKLGFGKKEAAPAAAAPRHLRLRPPR